MRDLNEGHSVVALEYEAHGPMALSEGSAILDEAQARFALVDAACVHRVGRLELGEVAIRVEVLGRHRAEAFAACAWIVDEVKRRVPIWKKEFYASGESRWVNAAAPSEGDDDRTEFYRRQMKLAEVGEEGQARLSAAHVVVIGAGGLGCPALTYLAAAGVGHLTIVDSDRVEVSNLHRQPLFGFGDRGRWKAEVAAEKLRSQNPFIQVAGLVERVTGSNVEQLFAEADLVIDATDNFETKFLLSDAAIRLGKALISASLYQFEGIIFVVQSPGPCLRCLWPETPDAGCVGSCAEVGVLGAVAGVIGTIQATEAIKLLLGMQSARERPAAQMSAIDLRALEVRQIKVPRRDGCPGCGDNRRVSPSLEIEPTADLSAYRLIDVREAWEVQVQPCDGAMAMPMSSFDPTALPDGPLVFVCQHGVRSLAVTKHLRQMGRDDVLSLRGGVALLTGKDLV